MTDAYFMAVIVLIQACFVSCTDGSVKGCTFDVPYHLMRNPAPEAIPLFFDIHVHIIALREAINSGGSFGVDAEYVLLYLMSNFAEYYTPDQAPDPPQ